MGLDGITDVPLPIVDNELIVPQKDLGKKSWKEDPEVITLLNQYANANEHREDSSLAKLPEVYKLLCLLGYRFINEEIAPKESDTSTKRYLNDEFVELLKEVGAAKHREIKDYTALFYDESPDGAKDLKCFIEYIPDEERSETVTNNLYGGNGFQGLVDLKHAQTTIEYEVGKASKNGTLGAVEDIDGQAGIQAMDEFVHIREKYYGTSKFVVNDAGLKEIEAIKAKHSALPATEKEAAELETYAGTYSLREDDVAETLTAKEIQAFRAALEIMNREEQVIVATTPAPIAPEPPPIEPAPTIVYKDEGVEVAELWDPDKKIDDNYTGFNKPKTYGFYGKNELRLQVGTKPANIYGYKLKDGEKFIKAFFIDDKQARYGVQPYVLVKRAGEYVVLKIGEGTAWKKATIATAEFEILEESEQKVFVKLLKKETEPSG